MTQYQKLGALLARTVGIAFALNGIIELMQMMRMVRMVDSIQAKNSSISIGSFIWAIAPTVVGLLIFTLAKPFGCFLAKGLEE